MSDSEDLVFEMGLYRARLPKRLKYSEVHFWFDLKEGRTRCGFTSYAMRLLGEIYRLDWQFGVGTELADADALGEIESTKASSELYAPMGGTISAINGALIEDPLCIADDPYATWLFEFDRGPQHALDAEQYRSFLAEGWEETQRMLKGQL